MLYKFLEKQYLDSFFETGSLRLGTVLDFKDTVKHGTARGDEGEGKHGIFRQLDGEVVLDGEKPQPIIDELIKVQKGSRVVLKGDGKFIVVRNSPDGFLFCTSNQYDDKLFKRWNAEEGADACYQIFNPKGFFHEITKVIQNSVSAARFQDVIYTPDPIPYDSPHAKEPPAYTKEESEYGWQKENRCIWQPKYPPLMVKPWILEVPEARKYCREYRLMDKGRIIPLNK